MQSSVLLVCAVLVIAACSGSGANLESTTRESTLTSEAEKEVTESMGRSGDFDGEIAADGLRLVGTLRIPNEADGTGVVFIHGSGPNARDGTLPGQLNMPFPTPIALFEELAEALADARIASLRYDKRTCGQFNGCADNDYPAPDGDVSVDDFIADAEAAALFMLSQPEVRRVFVIGHSQGGTFVPILLDRNPDFAGGVMLATPKSTIDVVLHSQANASRELAQRAGMEPSAIEAAVGPLDGLADAVTGIREGTFQGTEVGGASSAFWQGWIDRSTEAQSLVPSLTQPLLIVSGSMDWNVHPEETGSWADVVGPNHRVEVLPCLTHAFNCVTQTDALLVTAADIGRSVDPSISRLLDEFLGSQ